MKQKPLPDLTVRTHELHDAAFKVAAINQAYQSPDTGPQQGRAYLDQMEVQLQEVRCQVTRLARAIRSHRKGR